MVLFSWCRNRGGNKFTMTLLVIMMKQVTLKLIIFQYSIFEKSAKCKTDQGNKFVRGFLLSAC